MYVSNIGEIKLPVEEIEVDEDGNADGSYMVFSLGKKRILVSIVDDDACLVSGEDVYRVTLSREEKRYLLKINEQEAIDVYPEVS